MLERRTLPGGITALVSTDLESAGFLAAFTERTGGVSEGAHASLNLGFGTGDHPDRVVANRGRTARALGLDSFVRGHQVHGATITVVGPDRRAAGFAEAGTAVPATDALVTTEPGLALSILTADCVPIALAAPSEGRLAVVHAGWRGVAAGVVAAALGAFERPGGILAAVGPAIGADHYEVGPEVVEALGRSGAEVPATPGRGERWMLDLPGTVAGILRSWGVRSIERSEDCTACLPDRFFSYRRDGRCGRQAMVAARR